MESKGEHKDAREFVAIVAIRTEGTRTAAIELLDLRQFRVKALAEFMSEVVSNLMGEGKRELERQGEFIR